MKKILLFSCILLVGCAVDTTRIDYEFSFQGPTDLRFSPPPRFDWMPPRLMWERNVRNCRSQPQCNAADLFNN